MEDRDFNFRSQSEVAIAPKPKTEARSKRVLAVIGLVVVYALVYLTISTTPKPTIPEEPESPLNSATVNSFIVNQADVNSRTQIISSGPSRDFMETPLNDCGVLTSIIDGLHGVYWLGSSNFEATPGAAYFTWVQRAVVFEDAAWAQEFSKTIKNAALIPSCSKSNWIGVYGYGLTYSNPKNLADTLSTRVRGTDVSVGNLVCNFSGCESGSGHLIFVYRKKTGMFIYYWGPDTGALNAKILERLATEKLTAFSQ